MQVFASCIESERVNVTGVIFFDTAWLTTSEFVASLSGSLDERNLEDVAGWWLAKKEIGVWRSPNIFCTITS
jgi:hypothetical protein